MNACRRCGGQPILIEDEIDHGCQVHCSQCGLATAWYSGPYSARADWNDGKVDWSRAKCFTTRAEDAGLTGLSFALGA